MGHPGDEILGLYGQTTYKNPKSIMMSPSKRYTEVDLQMRASKHDWGLRTTLKGDFYDARKSNLNSSNILLRRALI